VTEAHERALVSLLLTASITSRVGNRVMWDSEEVDVQVPSITLRLLSTQIPARELRGRGGIRRCLFEVSAHAATSTAASQLCDAIIEAMTPRETGPFSVTIQGGEARFGYVHLDDVTHAFGVRAGVYRKAARFIGAIIE
jgi:hypothetical protein